VERGGRRKKERRKKKKVKWKFSLNFFSSAVQMCLAMLVMGTD